MPVMKEGGVEPSSLIPKFTFLKEVPEGAPGYIDQDTLGLAIIERLDYIAYALEALLDKSGDA